ncbi:sodium/hydrogen exchanger 3 family protein [Aphelenchoides avenae]|nr:sodium/hydrogen exchanger 3 family protein [Aphelenchus avenae]
MGGPQNSFGFIIHHEIRYGRRRNTELYLHPDLFFMVLVPPIALDAGYSLHIGEFIRNIGAILTYAVFATVFNTAGIAAILYVFKSYYPSTVSVMNIAQFAMLISAVDPVAVISVFEEMHVNRVLYICVFGESLLNDAVSVVGRTGRYSQKSSTSAIVGCFIFPYMTYVVAEALGLSGMLA